MYVNVPVHCGAVDVRLSLDLGSFAVRIFRLDVVSTVDTVTERL